MPLDSWEYRDPADVAERREQQNLRNCPGCRHSDEVHLWGDALTYCHKRQEITDGKRCHAFQARR